MQGPDQVPRVELGVAGDEAAAAHHAVAHLIETIQDLREMFRKRMKRLLFILSKFSLSGFSQSRPGVPL